MCEPTMKSSNQPYKARSVASSLARGQSTVCVGKRGAHLYATALCIIVLNRYLTTGECSLENGQQCSRSTIVFGDDREIAQVLRSS